KEQGLVLGAGDGRYTARPSKSDPLPDGSRAVLATLGEAYARFAGRWLGVRDASGYATESPVAGLEQWDWGSHAGPFGNWAYEDLVRDAMQRMPQLRVVVGVGYYDTLTTMGASEYLLAQAGWPPGRTQLA